MGYKIENSVRILNMTIIKGKKTLVIKQGGNLIC